MNHTDRRDSTQDHKNARIAEAAKAPKRAFWRRRADREVKPKELKFPGLALIGPNRLPGDWPRAA